MIEVAIKGHPKRISKTQIRRAAHFFADKLMYPRLHQNIQLEIVFDGSDLDLKRDQQGACQPYYTDNTGRARFFDIILDPKLSHRITLESLAHEMVHLRQQARGELYQYDRKQRLYRWRKGVIDSDKYYHRFLPWEVECYGMEYALYELFMDYDNAEPGSEKRKQIDKISARKVRYINPFT